MVEKYILACSFKLWVSGVLSLWQEIGKTFGSDELDRSLEYRPSYKISSQSWTSVQWQLLNFQLCLHITKLEDIYKEDGAAEMFKVLDAETKW